ncbi:MAG: arginine--tRNA ligase [Bacilli bacterium]|nr:arginine--tRNA ligase [Bacilli bacterium]
MDIERQIKEKIIDAFKQYDIQLQLNDVVIERSKDKLHGDYASNVALKNSRSFSKPPREVAQLIIDKLDMSGIDKVEIAGPGFINFFMKHDSLQAVVKKIINEVDNYGRGDRKNKKINVEFVSANPTGTLHIGHARGAAIGDVICRLYEFAGYDVTREYYINDAGSQINNLALSLDARYREALGLPFELPKDGYHGDDVKNLAKKLVEEHGDSLLNKEGSLEFYKELGIKLMLAKIIEDLKYFGVTFDVFSSEKVIRSNNAVEKELEFLKSYIYEEEGAKFLKTTQFLDDKDRVIVKANGDYTYFLPDIVYHVNKMSRGFDQLIDVLGADHHGYINRMKSALMMHGYDKDALQVELIQMVRIMKGDEEVKISKRTGNALTLRELCEEVGVDATRYFFAMRSASMHLDFDLQLALEQSSNNPVYYAQYAHARLCSVLEQASDIELDLEAKNLATQSELSLLKHLIDFSNVVEESAKERTPYKITNYIHRTAELIHAFYTECRVIDRDNLEITQSRLALCKAASIVLKNALTLVGVTAPTHM